MPDCGAKTRAGSPCRMAAMANGRCRMHGGMTPTGIASSHYVHGGRSAYLPTHLLPRFRAALADLELLNLSPDLALIEARLAEILGGIEARDAAAAWRDLAAVWDDLLVAQAARDRGRINLAAAKLGRLIETGASAWAAWDGALDLIERRRRLVESEGKRRVRMQTVLDAERAMALVTALAESVKRHVADEPTLRAIAADFDRLLGGADADRAAAAE